MDQLMLRTGEPVIDKRLDSCDVPQDVLAIVLLMIGADDFKTGSALKKTVPLGSRLRARQSVFPVQAGEEVIWARRWRTPRLSPHVVRPPDWFYADHLTLILELQTPAGSSPVCGLGAAYFGPPSPPELLDLTGLQRELDPAQAAEEARNFWGDPVTRTPGAHAFRLGAFSLHCTRCNQATVHRAEATASLEGNQVLCRDCEDAVLDADDSIDASNLAEDELDAVLDEDEECPSEEDA